MSRKVLLLNMVLAGLLVWLGVRLSGAWQDSKAREQAAMTRKPQPPEVKAPAPVPAVETPQATQYIDVATKMLFSKDRNPVEILPPPPPPPPVKEEKKPDPPPPAMPVYYGTFALGDPAVILALDGKQQKSYRKGEDVGEFKLDDFDSESLTLSWHEKTFHKTFAELKPKEPPRPAQVAAAPASSSASSGPVVTKIGGSSSPNSEKQQSTGPRFGDKQGNIYLCASGDTSPDGTTLDGYRLKRMDNLFSSTCQWEPMKP